MPGYVKMIFQFQKVSHYVKAILSGKGYYEAADKKSADLIVDVTYGTKNPHVEFDVRQGQVPSARTAGIWDPTGRNRYPQGGPYGRPGQITIGGRDRDGRYTQIVTRRGRNHSKNGLRQILENDGARK